MVEQNPFPGLRRERTRSTTLNWGRALPAVVRLLADRRSDVALPTCPLNRAGERHDETFARALAYWTALDHILRYQLGWTAPAQGLAHWIGEGCPNEIRPLALVRHVWLGDGFLGRYLAWRQEKCSERLPTRLLARMGGTSYEGDREGEPVGPWQLHLEDFGMHVLAPATEPPPKLSWLHPLDSPLSRQSPGLVPEPEAVLLFSGTMESGWYGALAEAPTSAVRVVSEQYGMCGRFIRSPITGRWHTCPEDVHAWGTP